MMEWQPLETAPEDEWVILATSGEHVGEAIMLIAENGAAEWRWAGAAGSSIHTGLKPLAWMPLPPPPSSPNRP